MRDLHKKLLRIKRAQRRSALALLLVLSTPAMTESSDSSTHTIRTNPFCEPVRQADSGGINLASGENQSTIRLKPIGKAIGLRTFDRSKTNAELPRDVSRSKMTIESVPSVIRTNPLIESIHRDDRNLVDVKVSTADRPANPHGSSPTSVASKRSTITLVPHSERVAIDRKPADPPKPPSTTETPTGRSQQPAEGSISEQLKADSATEPRITRSITPLLRNASPTAVVEPPAERQPDPNAPITFSLSDRNDGRIQNLDDRHDVNHHQDVQNNRDRQNNPSGQGSQANRTSGASEAAHGVENLASQVAKRETIQRQPETLRLEAPRTEGSRTDAPSIIRAMPQTHKLADRIELESAPAPSATESSESDVKSAASSPVGPSIIRNNAQRAAKPSKSKRYRPPVEVEAIPVEIARSTDEQSSPIQVEIVAEFDPGKRPVVAAKGVQPTKLKIDLAQVRSMTVGGRLQKIQVADTTVCKVVATGSSQLKLIGAGEGMTQLVIYAVGEDTSKPPLRRTFQIEVSDVPEATGPSLAETCKTLNQSIQETYPGCNVVVLDRDDQLTVAGRCDSQASAKKILRMVRKTCLVPVRDELIVQ